MGNRDIYWQPKTITIEDWMVICVSASNIPLYPSVLESKKERKTGQTIKENENSGGNGGKATDYGKDMVKNSGEIFPEDREQTRRCPENF